MPGEFRRRRVLHDQRAAHLLDRFRAHRSVAFPSPESTTAIARLAVGWRLPISKQQVGRRAREVHQLGPP